MKALLVIQLLGYFLAITASSHYSIFGRNAPLSEDTGKISLDDSPSSKLWSLTSSVGQVGGAVYAGIHSYRAARRLLSYIKSRRAGEEESVAEDIPSGGLDFLDALQDQRASLEALLTKQSARIAVLENLNHSKTSNSAGDFDVVLEQIEFTVAKLTARLEELETSQRSYSAALMESSKEASHVSELERTIMGVVEDIAGLKGSLLYIQQQQQQQSTTRAEVTQEQQQEQQKHVEDGSPETPKTGKGGSKVKLPSANGAKKQSKNKKSK